QGSEGIQRGQGLQRIQGVFRGIERVEGIGVENEGKERRFGVLEGIVGFVEFLEEGKRKVGRAEL
ncbi:MAG TPA: hypothetical protein VND64_23195, partial [Pirellulales bacterium]|nr:hypothetical protein [Pirellulales bacterium]